MLDAALKGYSNDQKKRISEILDPKSGIQYQTIIYWPNKRYSINPNT